MGLFDCIQEWLNDKRYSIDEYYRLREEELDRLRIEVDALRVVWKDSDEYVALISEGYVVTKEMPVPIIHTQGTTYTEEIKTIVEMLPKELHKEPHD